MTHKPERSVEEIVKEFSRLSTTDVNKGGWDIPYEGVLVTRQEDWLTQTLTSEAKKREEAVRELYQALKYQNTERELRAETHERMGIKLAFDQFILQFCTKHGIDRETLTNDVTEKDV